MRIVLAIPELPPKSIGGGGVVYKNLIEFYSEDHELLVIYGDYTAKGFKNNIKKIDNEKTNVITYEIPELPYPNRVPALKTIMPATPINLWRVGKIIEEFNPDVAHVHGYGHFFVDSIVRILVKQSVPYLFTNHGFPKFHKRAGGLIYLGWRCYMIARGNYIHKHAELVTCVSEATKSEYSLGYNRKYDRKIIVISNGINIPNYDVDAHLDHKDKILLSVGRISVIKGFQDIISVLPRIKSVKYIIVGEDGGYKTRLMSLVHKLGLSDRVEFTGPLEPNLVAEFYRNADVVAIPSHSESFGLVGLEALSFKKPVIHSGNEGLVYLNKSLNAYNYSKDGFENTYYRIEKFKDDNFLENYKWVNISKKYIEALDEIC